MPLGSEVGRESHCPSPQASIACAVLTGREANGRESYGVKDTKGACPDSYSYSYSYVCAPTVHVCMRVPFIGTHRRSGLCC